MAYEKVLDCLGEPMRRRLFDRLGALGPSSVAALAGGLPISRPAVSQHLKVLKEAGLVCDDAVGTRRIYRVDSQGLTPLRAWLDRLEADDRELYQAEIQRQLDERKCT